MAKKVFNNYLELKTEFGNRFCLVFEHCENSQGFSMYRHGLRLVLGWIVWLCFEKFWKLQMTSSAVSQKRCSCLPSSFVPPAISVCFEKLHKMCIFVDPAYSHTAIYGWTYSTELAKQNAQCECKIWNSNDSSFCQFLLCHRLKIFHFRDFLRSLSAIFKSRKIPALSRSMHS